MTEHFNEVQKCVKAYFDEALLNGRDLLSIIDGFKTGPLPIELRNSCSAFSEQEIRRHGQLVSTKYLIRHNEEQSARIPDTDLLGVQIVNADLDV
jgi:hypothetical protein